MHLRAHRVDTRGIAVLLRERGVVILLADRLIAEERLGARQILLRVLERRLRLCEIGLRLLERRQERLPVDDEQQLILLDMGAVGVRLALEETADARTDFNRIDRFRLADIFFEHGDGRRRQANHRDFGRRRWRGRGLLPARREREDRDRHSQRAPGLGWATRCAQFGHRSLHSQKRG